MPQAVKVDAIEARWLDSTNTTGDGLTDLLVPYAVDAMQAYEVSTLVNSVKNDSEAVLTPVP